MIEVIKFFVCSINIIEFKEGKYYERNKAYRTNN